MNKSANGSEESGEFEVPEDFGEEK